MKSIIKVIYIIFAILTIFFYGVAFFTDLYDYRTYRIFFALITIVLRLIIFLDKTKEDK